QPVCQTHARTQVPPVRIGSAHGATRVVILTAIEEAQRRVGITFGSLSGPGLEAQHTPLTIEVGQIRIPAQAQVQRQAVVDLPVVLHEEAPARAQEELELAAALAVLG